ncbi:MAG: hypothetical protein ABH832_03120 [bacterium]
MENQVLILAGLPASGKNLLSMYLRQLPHEQLADMHMMPIVHLDDYVYVQMMRLIDRQRNNVGMQGLFYWNESGTFRNQIDWGTLIHLLMEDYKEIGTDIASDKPFGSGLWLMGRFYKARLKADASSPLAMLNHEHEHDLLESIGEEVNQLRLQRIAQSSKEPDKCTVLVEISRGVGIDCTHFPASPPMGYEYAFSQMLPEVLERAGVLYVHVTPAESKHRNTSRRLNVGHLSGQHSFVPDKVMRECYERDDVRHLVEQSGQRNAIKVACLGKDYVLPMVHFDNHDRDNLTDFLCGPSGDWDPEMIILLNDRIKSAMDKMLRIREEITAR